MGTWSLGGTHIRASIQRYAVLPGHGRVGLAAHNARPKPRHPRAALVPLRLAQPHGGAQYGEVVHERHCNVVGGCVGVVSAECSGVRGRQHTAATHLIFGRWTQTQTRGCPTARRSTGHRPPCMTAHVDIGAVGGCGKC